MIRRLTPLSFYDFEHLNKFLKIFLLLKVLLQMTQGIQTIQQGLPWSALESKL
jgi:hypothetical protein